MAACAPHALAEYPIASHRYLANPTSLVTEDRVYVYCSNGDESPAEGSDKPTGPFPDPCLTWITGSLMSIIRPNPV